MAPDLSKSAHFVNQQEKEANFLPPLFGRSRAPVVFLGRLGRIQADAGRAVPVEGSDASAVNSVVARNAPEAKASPALLRHLGVNNQSHS